MPDGEYPLWLVVAIGLLGAFGTFFTKIKSSIELMFNSRHEIEVKKLDSEEAAIEKLRARIEGLEIKNGILEEKNLKLITSNTALSTAMIFIMNEIEKTSPENTGLIENLRTLIKNTLVDPHANPPQKKPQQSSD